MYESAISRRWLTFLGHPVSPVVIDSGKCEQSDLLSCSNQQPPLFNISVMGLLCK